MKTLIPALLFSVSLMFSSCTNTVEAQYAAVETERIILTLDGESVAVIHAEKTKGVGLTIVVDDMDGRRLGVLGKE